MDLEALRARVRRLTSINSDAILTDSDLDQVINEVYREVASLDEWPFLNAEDTVAVVADDREITLPAAMRLVRSVVLHDNTERDRLHNVDYSELEKLYDETDDTGRPAVWSLKDETTLYIHPPADQSYTLGFRGALKVDELALATDEPAFDDEFHPMIAYGAAARLLAEEGDESGRIQAYVAEAAGYLTRLRDRYLVSHDKELFQMGGRASRRYRDRWTAEAQRWRD